MPPRFAYWTVLIDNAPTAFRARDAEELLPTVAQLKRTNPNVVLKWFARGRLWDSQQQERDDFQRRKWRPAGPPGQRHDAPGGAPPERRSKDWRPGGNHKDPRARFSREKRREAKRPADTPWQGKPKDGDQRWQRKRPHAGKPWQGKPTGTDKPWRPKPPSAEKPWQEKVKRGGRPSHGQAKKSERPWHGQPKGGSKPWQKDRRFRPKPQGQSFKTKWTKDGDPHKKRDTPEDE